MIKVINDEIIATIFGAVLILNGDLETLERFNAPKKWARAIDGNEDYFAIGYTDGSVCFFKRNGDDDDESTVRNGRSFKKR